MGLRLRIAVLLLLPLALLAALTQWLLHEDMQRQVDALEQLEAQGELRRGMAALEGQGQNLSGVLRSWANWTALYEHAVKADTVFRDEELTVEALAVGRIDWLGLADAQGGITEVVEVSRPDGGHPARSEIERQAGRYQRFFSDTPREPACGLARASGTLALVCHAPVRRSDGTGTFVGHVFIGRWMDPAMMALMARQIGRDLQVAADPIPAQAPAMAVPSAAPRTGVDSMFDESRLSVRPEAGLMHLDVPLVNLFGDRVGVLSMAWPRLRAQEAASRLENTRRVGVLLVLASGLLLVLLLDQLVVKRLAALRSELATILEQGHWHGQVTQRGHDEIGQLAGFFNRLLVVVRQQMGELRDQSTTDALTGLSNRRAFDERLNYLLVRHARHGTPCALIVLDVDHFKPFNDSLGHPAGDEALRMIGRALRLTVRRQLDMPARMGGEEFGVLLEDADVRVAAACAESIRSAVQALAVDHPANAPHGRLSVSAGVASFLPGDTPDALYQRADQALYASKQSGRNRVTVAEIPVPDIQNNPA